MAKKDETLEERKERKKRFWTAVAYVLVGVLTTGILIGVKHGFEHTPDGQRSEFPLFGFLQRALSNFDAENPIVLIDISDLSECSDQLVPILKETVESLKTLHHRPLAIAVDVDFSPRGIVSSDVIEFFETCRQRHGDDVPVFLGVGDNKSASPGDWLGFEEYKDLAAAVAINEKDTQWIPTWVQANQGVKLNTLNHALALRYPKGLIPRPSWLAKAIETGDHGAPVTRERGEVNPYQVTLTYGERLVNYSKLHAMKHSAITVSNLQEAKSIGNDNKTYGGKLVLIGDVRRAKDRFPIPTDRRDEAGSLLLASSTYTLIKEPLFAFTWKVELALDLLIAALIIFPVAFIRYRNPNTSSLFGKQALYIYAFILLIPMLGFALVRLAGVIWPDCFFVVAAVVLHPKVEKVVHPIASFVFRPIVSFVRRLVAKLKPSDPSSPTATGTIENAAPPAPGPVESAIVVLALTLLTTTSVQAQQQRPEELCQPGIGVVAVEIKRDAEAKKKKETCQYCEKDKACEKDKDPWHNISEADLLKAFRQGEKLRCSRPCSLVIFICGRGNTRTINYFERKDRPGWFVVNSPYRIPRVIVDPNPDTPAKELDDPGLASAAPDNPNPRTDAEIITGGVSHQWYAAQASPTPDRSPWERMAGVTSTGSVSGVAAPTRPKTAATPSPTPRIPEATSSAVANATELIIRPDVAPATPSTPPEPFITEEQRKLIPRFLGLLTKGNTERDAKNYAAAEQAYLEANKLFSSDSRPWYGLGNVYFDQKRWTEAEVAYRGATFRESPSSQVYLLLASLLINSQEKTVDKARLTEAENYLWTAAKLDPRNERVYSLLDLALRKRGAKPDEFEAAYRRALGFYPASVSTNLRLSTLLRRLDRKEEAKKYLKIAEETALTPDQLLDVATVLESQEKLSRAERFAHRAIKLDAKNSRAYMLLGLVKIDREKHSAALPLLQKAIQYHNDDFAARYLSAIAHFEIGNLAESERFFDEATTRASSARELDAATYWLTVLGDAYIQRGRTVDAVRVFGTVLKHKPDDVETREKVFKIQAASNP